MLQASERPNIYCETLGPDQFGIIEKPLTLAEQIYNKVWLRKIAILIVLALAWELYGRWLDNPLLVPPFSAAMRALITDVANGTIPRRAASSIEVLLIGFATGTVLAALLTVFAISSKIGTDFLDTMTAMFNPLPAIALLPLALIWFGLGIGSWSGWAANAEAQQPPPVEKLTPDEKKKADDQQKMLVQKNNAAVDELQAVVGRFNEQLKIFKAKQKPS